MHAMALWCSLLCGAAPLDDGTLLFLENANSVVRVATGGKIGHVAIVMSDSAGQWIYEATPAKVRRVRPDDYYAELARINARRKEKDRVRVLALAPTKPYTPKEIEAMRSFLDGQLGRRYSVLNYLKEEKEDGIHCAELAAATLNQSGRYAFADGGSIHPSAFYDLVKPSHAAPAFVAIPDAAPKETWCQRANRRWGEIWRFSCWSCGEAWAFCW
jgi:hypothetical protein